MKTLNQLLSSNRKEVIRAYGKNRAIRANIGWATTDLEVCSKVYATREGQKAMCVTTSFDKKRNKYVHSHTEYRC